MNEVAERLKALEGRFDISPDMHGEGAAEIYRLEAAAMTFRRFHNAMRVLFNIDADEFLRATTGKYDWGAYPNSSEWRDWELFQNQPHDWFLRAPTAKAEAIYALIEARNSTA